GRPPRRHLVPLAGGPDREAVPAAGRAGLHVPAGLPGLRLRLAADDARDAAPRDPSERRGDRAQPACTVGAPPRRDEGLMATVSHAQAASVAEPAARPRPRPRRRSKARARGGILWIAIGGILLAGV